MGGKGKIAEAVAAFPRARQAGRKENIFATVILRGMLSYWIYAAFTVAIFDRYRDFFIEYDL